jgi:hypothetical protein
MPICFCNCDFGRVFVENLSNQNLRNSGLVKAVNVVVSRSSAIEKL